jgi:hypothetical protein
LKLTQKKTVVAHFKLQPQHLPVGTDETTKTCQPSLCRSQYSNLEPPVWKSEDLPTWANLFDPELRLDLRQVAVIWGQVITPEYSPFWHCVKCVSNRLSGCGGDTRGRITSRLCVHVLYILHIKHVNIQLNMCGGVPERMPASIVFRN